MKVTKKQLLCKAGTTINEDIANITNNGAWILDGATGLNGRNVIDNESDARWFVNWWNNYLLNNIDKNESLKDIIKLGIKNIKAEFYKICKNTNITELDIPSSTIVVLKWHENIIEYICLGDSALILQKNNQNEIISDINLKSFDDKVFNSMKNLITNHNMDLLQAKNELMDIIIQNRLMKNKKNGYWILSLEENAVDYAYYGKIEINTDTKFLLATDGFLSISEKYNTISIDDLLPEVEKRGLNNIYKKIREVEEYDYQGKLFPRFKKGDDVSAIFINMSI